VDKANAIKVSLIGVLISLLLFEFSCFFRQIFGGQKFGGEFAASLPVLRSTEKWHVITGTLIFLLLTYLLTYLQWPAAFVKPPLVKAGPLRDGDVLLSVCLFVCLSVCRLRNLWSHSLRGSTLRRAGAYHVDSDTLICDSIALISKSIIMITRVCSNTTKCTSLRCGKQTAACDAETHVAGIGIVVCNVPLNTL